MFSVFVLAGVEHARIVPGFTRVEPFDFYDYPISHGLVADAGWAVLAGAIYFALRRQRAGAIALALAVFSHWVCDFVAHGPDMPILSGNGPRIGLGLWNSHAATLLAEAVVFGGGLFLYLKRHSARIRPGIGFWSLVAFLVAIQLGNPFVPPPASIVPVALLGLAMLPLVFWAHRVDRVSPVAPPSAARVAAE